VYVCLAFPLSLNLAVWLVSCVAVSRQSHARKHRDKHAFCVRYTLISQCQDISVSQRDAVCCSVLQCVAVQCVAVCCSASRSQDISVLQCVVVCCSVLQCVAVPYEVKISVCCSAVCCSVLQRSVSQCVAVQCVAVCCMAVCRSVLQCSVS